MPLLEDTIHKVSSQYSCRKIQTLQLGHLLNPDLPSPQTLVLHGLPSSGKTSILRSILTALSESQLTTIVPVRECITTRQLLERTVADLHESLAISTQQNGSIDTIDTTLEPAQYARTESCAILVTQLERMLSQQPGKCIIAFDAIDTLPEPLQPLIPALCRLPESLTNITVIFTLTTPQQSLFTPGTAYIHFPAYTREEALSIISTTPLSITQEIAAASYTSEDEQWLWDHFTAVVWDSLSSIADNSLPAFRSLCNKLWPEFTRPVREGKYKPREFSRLMIAQRALFQRDDALLDTIEPSVDGQSKEAERGALPPFAIYVLCAAYLASYNHPRTDIVHFSEWSERKKKRRKGGRRNVAKKDTTASGHRRIPRQSLPPSTFSLARLLAVLSAIYPHPVSSAQHPATLPENVQVDVLGAVATLASVRLILKSGGGGDVLDEACKWKVNVERDVVIRIGREVGVEIGDWSGE